MREALAWLPIDPVVCGLTFDGDCLDAFVHVMAANSGVENARQPAR